MKNIIDVIQEYQNLAYYLEEMQHNEAVDVQTVERNEDKKQVSHDGKEGGKDGK